MFTSFLIATAFAAPVSASTIDAAAPTNAQPVIGLLGETLGSSDDFAAAVGGNYTNPFELDSMRLVQAGIYEITLRHTGTGWDETMLLAVPPRAAAPVPLLVAFHGYSSTPYSVLYQTDYLEKARARGWYAIAPMGAHKYNYGVDYAMDNIEAAIRWAFRHGNIDPDRVYGVGFSMGGGVAAAYAARHTDPTKPRFAAIVNHTGTVSMRDTFNNATNTTLLQDPQMFAGTPDQFPFAYAKASTIDYDMFTDLTDQSNDLARNLKTTPVYQWAVAGDPQAHLVHQADLLHGQVQLRGGTSNLNIGLGSVHTWESLDERAVLNFLQSKVRQDPTPGTKTKSLVHEDGRYYHFDVTQRSAGQFSSFEWKVLSGINRLYLEKVENVDHFLVDANGSGLQASNSLQVVVQANDAGSIVIELSGFSTPPTNVLRDSISTAAWTWDAQHQCVSLIENDPSGYRLWSVEP